MSLLFRTETRAHKHHPRVLKALKALSQDDWRVVVTESAQRLNGVTTTLLPRRLDRIVAALVKLDQKTWRDVVAVSAWPAGYAKSWGTHGRQARAGRQRGRGARKNTVQVATRTDDWSTTGAGAGKWSKPTTVSLTKMEAILAEVDAPALNWTLATVQFPPGGGSSSSCGTTTTTTPTPGPRSWWSRRTGRRASPRSSRRRGRRRLCVLLGRSVRGAPGSPT